MKLKRENEKKEVKNQVKVLRTMLRRGRRMILPTRSLDRIKIWKKMKLRKYFYLAFKPPSL